MMKPVQAYNPNTRASFTRNLQAKLERLTAAPPERETQTETPEIEVEEFDFDGFEPMSVQFYDDAEFGDL